MSEQPEHASVRSRNESFTPRTATKIWAEQPSGDNPYIATRVLCHGYDLLELMEKRSFVDVFYLLFRGELPTSSEAKLLQSLMIALINPGPRHPATRSAMSAGVGKTDPLHILPIASAVLGGEHCGGGAIESAMRFFRRRQAEDPLLVAEAALNNSTSNNDSCPGFGMKFGGVDLLAKSIAQQLALTEGAGEALRWGSQLADALNPHGWGWLNTGIAAAVFADLGFHPRAGGSLFQLLGSPGLVAHGLELANKPITAMPFVGDEDYVIES